MHNKVRTTVLRWLVAGWLVVGWFVCGGEFRNASAETTSAAVNSFDSTKGETGRTRSGLQVLYNFSPPTGAVVKDRSGVGAAMDLRIANTNAVSWNNGGLAVNGKTSLRSDKAATKITDAIRLSGRVTIEAWIRPTQTDQRGPARILTLSKDSSERNFTLGQEGDTFDVRFRTTQTTANGTPSLSSKPGNLTTDLTHVVYTRERTGRSRIYLNGKLNAEQTVSGDLSNWIGSYRLALANEHSNDRPWLGTFYLVAIYSRDLLPHEVEQHFKAGARWQENLATVAQRNSDSARLFDEEIAPLFVKHCLECHDTATKEGKLDLSRKTAALAGGKKGKAIVPGNSAESRIWKSVEADEMPDERPPLSAHEKEILRKWIDSGASWTTEVIEPAVYNFSQRPSENWLRRLTLHEYIETVRSAVGIDIAKEATEILPKDLRADGFNNTAYNLSVDLGHVEAYARLAEIVVGRMDVSTFAAEFAPSQKLTADNMRNVIASSGKWILRGPLDEREVTAFLDIQYCRRSRWRFQRSHELHHRDNAPIAAFHLSN